MICRADTPIAETFDTRSDPLLRQMRVEIRVLAEPRDPAVTDGEDMHRAVAIRGAPGASAVGAHDADDGASPGSLSHRTGSLPHA